jgi:hypothetical protein
MPPPIPQISVNLKFAQINEISHAPGYLKMVPSVYRDHPLFDFQDHDFELREKDKVFLREIDITEE